MGNSAISNPDFVVIGGGPAGLAAAYEAVQSGQRVVVLETEDQIGGLSKTVFYKGYGFDIGGHRFFTKLDPVKALWNEILPDDFICRPRLSRIYYKDRYFRYPLRMGDAMFGLGLWQGVEILASFLRARLVGKREEKSLEDWVTNRFGFALYSLFFKSYTEKVWGIPCNRISADWAAQRIKSLNLLKAGLNALGVYRGGESATLSETFHYPRLGPGQLYGEMSDRIQKAGSRVLTEHRAMRFDHEGGIIRAAVCETPEGQREIEGDRFISSMPIDDLIHAMNPAPPPEVLRAAEGLTYRAILTANVIVDQENICPDNWIYLHAPDVRAGRMQNYKNWSPDLVPEKGRSSLGLEYFATRGDELWNLDSDGVLDLARRDLDRLGLVHPSKVADGCAVRYARAYPIYNLGYRKRLETIRAYLDGFFNLQCIGRAGQFRYNNMDHSIYTGMLAVRKALGEPVDPWDVNEDPDYHEVR